MLNGINQDQEMLDVSQLPQAHGFSLTAPTQQNPSLPQDANMNNIDSSYIMQTNDKFGATNFSSLLNSGEFNGVFGTTVEAAGAAQQLQMQQNMATNLTINNTNNAIKKVSQSKIVRILLYNI